MTLSRIVPLMLLLLAPLARAADGECLVEPKVLKPQFAAKLPRGFKLVSTKKEKKQIKQVLKLADGYEATVTVGGCEHLLATIAIKGPGLTTKTVGAELVAICRRVLPSLPMDKDVTIDPKLMLQAIEEARINIMPAQLPCGQATCQLSLEADDAKPAKAAKPAKKPAKGKEDKDKVEPPPSDEAPGVLKLSYDFPL